MKLFCGNAGISHLNSEIPYNLTVKLGFLLENNVTTQAIDT